VLFGSPRSIRDGASWALALITLCASAAPIISFDDGPGPLRTGDPVVARVYEHLGAAPRPIVQVVDSSHFPPPVWKRMQHLVAFRIHRQRDGQGTLVDAAIYLVHESDLYLKAAAALRNHTTNHEYVWCLLTAVLAHEAAHTAPGTERQALSAEAQQLRRCLLAGHLHAADGWNGLAYLQKVEARRRQPREHY
jgi:hypothetical protein